MTAVRTTPAAADTPALPILQVEDLAVSFGDTVAVESASFQIHQGETVALVGESGSGKSVTALSLLQLLPHANQRGSIRILGEEITKAPPRRLQQIRGAVVSMVFQEPMTSLNPLHTVGKQIFESLMLHAGLGRPASRTRALELLDRVGLARASARLNDYPHQLSGGERQRVMIAMALANQPKLLIADEPTTALDATIQKQILALLSDLRRDLDMAMLLITHDLGIVRHSADRLYVMQAGRIVEAGSSTAVFSHPRHPYTRRLIEAEPTGTAPRFDRTDEPVLRANHLSAGYAIGKGWFGKRRVQHAVKDVTLAVRPGETVGIVGESGSGKSTLGFALLRLLGSTGEIYFSDRPLHAIRSSELKRLRRRMQVVFQDPYGSLSPRMTVRAIIEEGLRVHERGLSTREREARVAQVLADVRLDPATMDRYPNEFSGGQRQRIAIARALILRPDLLVLDEPTSALDMTVQAQIVDLLRDLQARHRLAYLFISHDLKVVRALANRIIVMRSGTVVEQGSVEQIFERPQTPYTRELIAAAL